MRVRTSGALAWWQHRERFLQVASDRGLTHNLGGHPQQNVCAVSIVGRHGA